MTKVSHAGFSHVQTKAGIAEYRLLANGLRVLHRREIHAPVAVVMVTYHVGSRNEVTGNTGATHILEHLLFKGSKRFNKTKDTHGDILLSNEGAIINATTWCDRTNYFAVLPAAKIELAIAIEADRMRGATFSADDLRSEMTVVRNEFERGKNHPEQIVDEALWATAFVAHPYRHPTIGWKSDIENVSVSALRTFYDTFYWPNNATVTVIGDVEASRVLALLKKHFARVPRSPHPIPTLYTLEPEQEGPRHVEIRRPKQTSNIASLGYKIPHGTHQDIAALHVLTKVLMGGKSGRLHRVLVDTGLSSGVDIFDHPFHDPGLYVTHVTLTRKLTHKRALDILRREFERIARRGVTPIELGRAKRQALVEFAYLRDGIYKEASVLNEAIALGDWTFYTSYLSSLEKVKCHEVQAVVRKYLIPSCETSAHFFGKSQ